MIVCESGWAPSSATCTGTVDKGPSIILEAFSGDAAVLLFGRLFVQVGTRDAEAASWSDILVLIVWGLGLKRVYGEFM